MRVELEAAQAARQEAVAETDHRRAVPKKPKRANAGRLLLSL
jgi:hypothetical protein